MNFTDSPYEKLMQEIPRPKTPAPMQAPDAMAAPTGGGSPVCPATGSF